MAEKKVSKSNFSIKRLIYNDKYLIIFSLCLAVLVWTVTSLNIGIDETKTIKVDVPITLGDEVSEQLGMQYYSLHNSIELNVTISGAKYVIGQVTGDDLNIKFDTSSVNRIGEQSIPILVTNGSKTLDFNVTSTYPSSIDGYFDVNDTKTFDLYLKYDESAVAEGYSFGNAVLSEDKVIISGPKTYVDKIDRASVNVDFGSDKDLTEPYSSECKINIEGSGVETSYLKITSKSDLETPIKTVSVTLPVLKEKMLPLEVAFDDVPKSVREDIVDVRYSLDSIDAGVLDSADIAVAQVGTISYNQLTVGKNEFNFDITNLQGITLLSGKNKSVDIIVTVSDSYEEILIPVKKSNVVITGNKADSKAKVDSISMDYITVVAPKKTNVTIDDIELKCDVSEVNKDNKYPIEVKIKRHNDSWIYGTYEANISITK